MNDLREGKERGSYHRHRLVERDEKCVLEAVTEESEQQAGSGKYRSCVQRRWTHSRPYSATQGHTHGRLYDVW